MEFIERGLNSKSRIRANKKRYDIINKAFNKGSFLDVGCGSCKGWDYLNLKKFSKKIGIDIDGEIIKKNKEKFKEAFFFVGDVTKKLIFGNESFDNISCVELIEHIDKPEILLKEIYRIIKPDGKVIITTPNKWVSLKGLFGIKNTHHFKEYSISEMKKMVSPYFKIEKINHVFCISIDVCFLERLSELYEKIMPNFLGTGMIYYLKPKKK